MLQKLHLCYKNYTYVAKNTVALQKPSQVGNLNPVSSVCQFSVSSHIIFFSLYNFFRLIFFSDLIFFRFKFFQIKKNSDYICSLASMKVQKTLKVIWFRRLQLRDYKIAITWMLAPESVGKDK